MLVVEHVQLQANDKLAVQLFSLRRTSAGHTEQYSVCSEHRCPW